jgi:hypothetical protein
VNGSAGASVPASVFLALALDMRHEDKDPNRFIAL